MQETHCVVIEADDEGERMGGLVNNSPPHPFALVMNAAILRPTKLIPGYTDGMTCPCGLGPSLEGCCGPFIDGRAYPDTAEQLMRSRYSAYATQRFDYVVSSHHPETRAGMDREQLELSSRPLTWLGLAVLSSEEGQPGDDHGVVEFVARYRSHGQAGIHQERSLFLRHQGKWHYHSEQPRKAAQPFRAEPTVGRNDPCPCGSDKKFKKCCGQ